VIKSLGVMRRKKGLTREQFLKHWEEIHGLMVLSRNVPGLRKYIQNHPAKVAGAEFDTNIDGIAELCFDDVESLQAFYQWLRSSDEARDLQEDGKLFINFEESLLFVVEEHVLKELTI
jgi:uncharacterized protein (TIGR02118 family)